VRLHPDPVFDRLLGDPGAADPAAVVAAGARIGVGDLAGWERFWRGRGDDALRRADDRLALDDVPGARQALLAAADAYGLAAAPLPADCAARRDNRAAQVAAFRAALPLLPVEAEIAGPAAYRFGADGPACRVVRLPEGVPAEAGYVRFAVPVLAEGLDCLVCEADPRTVDEPHR